VSIVNDLDREYGYESAVDDIARWLESQGAQHLAAAIEERFSGPKDEQEDACDCLATVVSHQDNCAAGIGHRTYSSRMP
jgi:hypothetical protein